MEQGDFETVHLLIDNGAAVNSVDHTGRSAMLHAAQHGRLEIVRVKVRKGFLPPRPASLNNDQWNLIEMMCASEPSYRLEDFVSGRDAAQFLKRVLASTRNEAEEALAP